MRVIALLNGEHKYYLFLVVMLVLCRQQAYKTILESKNMAVYDSKH